MFTFLEQDGINRKDIVEILGDASNRQYARLHYPSCLYMDATYDNTCAKNFQYIDNHMASYGLAVPRIYQYNETRGTMIIEDFGSNSLNQHFQKHPNKKITLLTKVIDVLTYFQQKSIHHTTNPHIGTYTLELFQKEVSLFVEWYLPSAHIFLTYVQKESFYTLWKNHHQSVHCIDAFVLRDFHADNIFVLNRPFPQNFGFIDFQDGKFGPLEYDIMSLLTDVRNPLTDRQESNLWTYYQQQIPHASKTTYTILALSRLLKILGIFTRLSIRDSKPNYLVQYYKNTYRLTLRLLQRKENEPIYQWFTENIPAFFTPHTP